MHHIIDKIVAHRGESFDYPENTLSAINSAWKLGAKAVEIDVHLTADNEIVVIHDDHTGRVGDKKLFVKKSKLVDLKTVDVGSKKSPKFKGERIPTLNEVLETVPIDSKLIIEIKCGLEIITPLRHFFENTHLENHQIEIISFNLEVVSAIKKNLPQFKALWVLDLDYYWPQWMLNIKAEKLIKTIQAHHLDGVDVWAGKVISQSFVDAFKNEGLLLYVWTVNDIDIARRVLAYGIDAFKTDRSEWMRKELTETNE